MGLTGDFAALAAFHNKTRKMSGVVREIALKVSPRIEGLVGASFSAQATPYGEPWTPTKSGAPAFGGGDAGGRVLVRLVGKATIKTSVLWPLFFHNAGTHSHGRKTQAALRRNLRKQGYNRAGIKGAIADFDKARKNAGNVHDPARPMIPEDGSGMPDTWTTTIRTSAVEVMRDYGAQEKK